MSHFGKSYSENETNETFLGPFELNVSFLRNVTVNLTVHRQNLTYSPVSELIEMN